MAEKKYDNIWTKLHLDKLRGNKLFKGIWRAARVGLVYGGLHLISELPGLDLVSEPILMALSPMLEKWLREFLPKTDF